MKTIFGSSSTFFAKSLLGSCTVVLSACGANTSNEDTSAETQANYSNAVLTSTNIWKVKVAAGTGILNCRENPNTSAPVIFPLRRGEVLDVIGTAPVKANGFVWINVYPRGNVDHMGCWIAADDRYIEPANNIDVNNYQPVQLSDANYATTKTLLNCRQFPGTSAPIVFADMAAGTKLNFEYETEFGFIRWSTSNNAYWTYVRPAFSPATACWVSAQKSTLSLIGF